MNWEHLRYFIALARHKTLTNTGKALQVSHATVYRKIKSFEEELGVTLFENTPSGYLLTKTARQFLEEMEIVESNIESSLRGLQGSDQHIRGEIVIATTDSIGCKLLPGIMKKFQTAYPDLSIEMKINLETISLAKREADIAVRASKYPPSSLVGRKIGSIHFAVFARESYLENFGSIQFPDDVGKHHFIVLDDSFKHLAIKQWADRNFAQSTQITKVNGMVPLIEFCESGIGLAALPLFAAELENSKLKLVHSIPELSRLDVWVLTHRDLLRSKRIQVTMEFLYRELSPYFN